MTTMRYPNRPSPVGRLLGIELARMTNAEEAAQRALGHVLPDRCRTCAFRLGTVPNGCATTQMDALKCAMERVEFGCHERAGQVCMGWLVLAFAGGEPVEAFWPFTDSVPEAT